MRHGRRTYFARFNFLFKVIHRYVGPHIPVKVHQDSINPFQGIALRGKIIVMLNLCGKLRAVKAQYMVYKAIAKYLPVNLRVGDMVGIKITRGPAEFS